MSDLVAFANECFASAETGYSSFVALVIDFGPIATLEPRQRETNACNLRNIVALPLGLQSVASESSNSLLPKRLLVYPSANRKARLAVDCRPLLSTIIF